MEKYILSKNKKLLKREKIQKNLIKVLNFKSNEKNILIKKIYNYFFNINNQIKQIHNNRIFFLIIIIIIYLITPIISKNTLTNKRLLEEDDLSEIKLIINATEDGDQEILHSGFGFEPTYIFVNGTSTNLTSNYTIFLEKNIYLITLKWNTIIINCYEMFSGLTNLIEIDFSKFNTSKVTQMEGMVKDCINLKKINFGNKFDTSLVEGMKNFFYNCTSLEYLDISSFNTSKNKNFAYMFGNCISLKSVNLGNMNTELAESMNEMFNG